MARRPRVNWIAREAELRQMVAEGKLLRDIGAHFGCSRLSAQKAMHRIGLVIDPEAVDRERRRILAEVNSRPDRGKRVADGIRRRHAKDPTYREKLRQATMERWQRPGFREAVVPKVQAIAKSEQGKQWRSKGGKQNAANKLAWCPPHLLDDYRRLCTVGHVPAVDAKATILRDWLAQLRRALRQIAAVAKPLAEQQAREWNSFEAKVARVKAGQARVVQAFRPGRHVSDDRSLIGCGSALAVGG